MAVKAQLPGTFGTMSGLQSGLWPSHQSADTGKNVSKWSFSKYAGLSTGFVGFRGGSSTYLSAPLALQVNRQLTNNIYAFGNLTLEPYVSRNNGGFLQSGAGKNGGFMQQQTTNFGAFSTARIGLMYTNNERTFSISGSIGVSRSSYNGYSPFYSPFNTPVLGNMQQ
ncbi:hypothetical protein [Chitinophaga rhizophila]|uniref:Uncharacterized protein n=1 Tax=Chitinophaga rhizophila TaxID=2866212 RepID=A0ABS7G862_9BACT|nr:hypothetical protein [Chitinophaga rhizophila]MBW8683581.1 hypothetical protein [Chitinophaga rhizophila]